MSKEVKKITLKSGDYQIGMFDPDRGFEVLLKLSKFIGPILTQLAGLAGPDGQNLNQEVDSNALALIGQNLFNNFNVPETKLLVKDLLSVVILGNKIVGDNLSTIQELKGNYGDIIILCKEVVDHNRFLESLGAIQNILPQN